VNSFAAPIATLNSTAGILTCLTSKTPDHQTSLVLSLVKPLLGDLSVNSQLFREKGWKMEDLPIVKVHDIVLALGNIAKGFPDYPSVVPENYIEVFSEIARVILVCLEAMNVFRVIRDGRNRRGLRLHAYWLLLASFLR